MAGRGQGRSRPSYIRKRDLGNSAIGSFHANRSNVGTEWWL